MKMKYITARHKKIGSWALFPQTFPPSQKYLANHILPPPLALSREWIMVSVYLIFTAIF